VTDPNNHLVMPRRCELSGFEGPRIVSLRERGCRSGCVSLN